MNGPQHYQRAEEYLKVAAAGTRGGGVEAAYLAAAQVHATLALAAATVEQAAHSTDWHAAVTS